MIRTVVVPIDTILEIAKDYCRETHDIPDDAKVTRLEINPSNRKFRMTVASPGIPEGAKDVGMNFEIKRVHTV